ncbi:MAG: hypothetical protein HC888_05095 [Candidatus Competibacteraceae bacterium]|nr:hypothetical protein [Candidatus Competibacteraceae bacterium]
MMRIRLADFEPQDDLQPQIDAARAHLAAEADDDGLIALEILTVQRARLRSTPDLFFRKIMEAIQTEAIFLGKSPDRTSMDYLYRFERGGVTYWGAISAFMYHRPQRGGDHQTHRKGMLDSGCHAPDGGDSAYRRERRQHDAGRAQSQSQQRVAQPRGEDGMKEEQNKAEWRNYSLAPEKSLMEQPRLKPPEEEMQAASWFPPPPRRQGRTAAQRILVDMAKGKDLTVRAEYAKEGDKIRVVATEILP